MIVLDLISLDGAWPDLGPISGDGLARLRRMEPASGDLTPDLWALVARIGEPHE